MNKYFPEGLLINTEANKRYLKDEKTMNEAYNEGLILEAKALLCDSKHNIIVELPNGKGIIPREEGAIGIAEGTTRDIALLSKVNKPVCFIITDISYNSDGFIYTLSRRLAQEECLKNYISKLRNGDVIQAKVTHLEQFGCFVDIGCGIPSLIPIDAISVSRISHPNDRFYNGQDIFVAVKSIDGNKVCLTHKELLGSWKENADLFETGQTVGGIVRSIEDYGIFIEIAPNLAGLAEPKANVKIGDSASVYIKAIIPEKMKIKLIIVDVFKNTNFPSKYKYFIKSGNISKWIYSTNESDKYICTEFI